MIKSKRAAIIAWALVILVLLAGVILLHTPGEKHETVQEMMRDAVLHESDHIGFFGIKEVNPAFIAAVVNTIALLVIAALVRIFYIPRFQYVPGRFQLLLEQMVGFFDGLAKTGSPHRNGFLGSYIFSAGIYVFLGTIFELFGLQAVTISGHSIALPAPLSDINAAIAMGCLSYLVIVSGGIAQNGIQGLGSALKEFSLPISMSFRLFGALLSGLLVTELVYYYIHLSFVVPVIVGILFTLLHAIIQTYVLTMLTATFYGQVSEPKPQKVSKRNKISRREPVGGFNH